METKHNEHCINCQCYTCKHDNMYCCSEHIDKYCNTTDDCPDYELDETEGEDND